MLKPTEAPHRNRSVSGLGLLSFLIVIIIIAVAAGGIYWYYLGSSKQSFDSTEVSQSDPDFPDPSSFGTTVDLSFGPTGLVWNGEGFMAIDHLNPLNLVYIGHDDQGTLEVLKIPVSENRVNPKIGFSGITWNGKNYISITREKISRKKGSGLFAVHKASDLSIVKYFRAPENLGCITWDGENYWAGTNFNMEYLDKPKRLYKLDKDFNIISQTEVSMVGCQGLTWDGYHILWANNFSNNLHLINVSGEVPKIVHKLKISSSYLTGLAFDEKSVWIADSRNNRIQRLDPGMQKQWLVGDFSTTDSAQLIKPDQLEISIDEETEQDKLVKSLNNGKTKAGDLPEIVELLISSNGYVDTKAILSDVIPRVFDSNMKRELRKHYERILEYGEFSYTDDRVLGDEAVQFSYLNVRIEDGKMIGSWQVLAGDTVVQGLESPAPEGGPVTLPRFIHYTIHIDGKTLGVPYKQQFEFSSDSDTQEDIIFLENLEKDRYVVRATMHAQYYANGGGKSYTSSVNPHIIRY